MVRLSAISGDGLRDIAAGFGAVAGDDGVRFDFGVDRLEGLFR